MSSDGLPSHSREARRTHRKIPEEGEGSHAREIELKRSRGEISCAECRRLKIKCDKKLPCSSCLRRGCASLCPNGSLATGQGTRFVLAATDHLHRRIAKMSERIRQLEDALSIVQSRVSDEPHPLLRDELLTIKVEKTEDHIGEEAPQETSEVIDAFGTLSINDRGNSRFFGAAGGTEMLLLNEEEAGSSTTPYTSPSATNVASPDSTRGSKSPHLPPEVTRFSNAFPFTPMGASREVQEIIESFLPTWERACMLSETYLEHAAWLFRAVSRIQLLDEMLPVIYKRKPPPDPSHEYNGPHDIAVLFMIFAVGALVDLNQEPYNAEAEHFYNLAKASLTLQSILEKAELTTIQALHLMAIYNAMQQPDGSDGESETSMEMSWSLIRLCHQLAQTIGLHRDSARWGLEPRDVQRRRALFWDLFVADSWQSLSTGRPPSITLPYIDCQFPLDDEATLNQNGGTEPGYGAWGFRFACECVSQVAAKTLTAQVPAYATILDLDARVREFSVPELPREFMESNRPSMIMTRYVLGHSREVILLCIHRSFFAQAMIDDPVNPLRSQYAPSFLASYRSASHILKVIREQFDVLPELCARFWSTWTYAFSAAVVFGSIVTRGPTSSMASSALQELDMACELFSKAAVHSRRAAKALAVLQRLQGKAHLAYESVERTMEVSGSPDATPQLNTPVKEEDELAIFGGRTRLVAKRSGFTPVTSPMGSSSQPCSNAGGNTPPASTSSPSSRHGLARSMSSSLSVSSANNSNSNPSAPASVSGSIPATPSLDEFDSMAAARAAALNEYSFAVRPQGQQQQQQQHGQSWVPTSVRDGMISANEFQRKGAHPSPFLDPFGQNNVNPFASGSGLSGVGNVNVDQEAAMKYHRMLDANVSAQPHHQPHHPSLPPNQSHLNGVDNYPSPGGLHQPQSPYEIPFGSHHPRHSQQGSQGYNIYENVGTPTGVPAASVGYGIPHSHSGAVPGTGPPPPTNANGIIGTGPTSSASSASYTLPPRELTEMGLVSQHSAISQRWTSFMHDSGVFYGGAGGRM